MIECRMSGSRMSGERIPGDVVAGRVNTLPEFMGLLLRREAYLKQLKLLHSGIEIPSLELLINIRKDLEFVEANIKWAEGLEPTDSIVWRQERSGVKVPHKIK